MQAALYMQIVHIKVKSLSHFVKARYDLNVNLPAGLALSYKSTIKNHSFSLCLPISVEGDAEEDIPEALSDSFIRRGHLPAIRFTSLRMAFPQTLYPSSL